MPLDTFDKVAHALDSAGPVLPESAADLADLFWRIVQNDIGVGGGWCEGWEIDEGECPRNELWLRDPSGKRWRLKFTRLRSTCSKTS